MSALERFVVRAELRSPWLGNATTLDALLAYRIFERTGDVDAAHRDIPLACSQGLWHASSAMFEGGQPINVSLIASLRAHHDLSPGDVAVSPRTGRHPTMGLTRTREYGNVQNRIDGYASIAVWWFASGDIDACRKLLDGIGFLGKKNTAGFGEVALLEIEPAATTDGLLSPDLQPLRPIPARLYNGDAGAIQAEAAWRPPYWRIGSRERCFVPDTCVRTREQLDSLL
jgi:hypothetical protein